MKKILLASSLSVILFCSLANAQWGTQPWGMNPWSGNGAFGLGPYGSASTPSVNPVNGALTFLGQGLTFLGSQLTYNP